MKVWMVLQQSLGSINDAPTIYGVRLFRQDAVKLWQEEMLLIADEWIFNDNVEESLRQDIKSMEPLWEFPGDTGWLWIEVHDTDAEGAGTAWIKERNPEWYKKYQLRNK